MAIALNEKAKERLAKQSSGKEGEKIRKSTVSYKSVSQMPRENEVKELKLYVGKCCKTKLNVSATLILYFKLALLVKHNLVCRDISLGHCL